MFDIMYCFMYYVFVVKIKLRRSDMENKIRNMWKVMSAILVISGMFYVIALNGVFSLTTGLVIFISTIVIVSNIRGKWGDERELYLYMAQSLGALLAGLSFMFIYMGVSHAKGIQPNHLFEYSIGIICLSQIVFYKLLKGKN